MPVTVRSLDGASDLKFSEKLLTLQSKGQDRLTFTSRLPRQAHHFSAGLC